MTFEQLYYFAQTYRLKSITKAADNLYVSRQSVSKAIHKLENEFRLPLFVRHTDGVKPTLAGDKFYHFALAILKEEAIFKQTMAQLAGTGNAHNDCRIYLPESLISLYGDALLDTLSQAFPETYFTMSTAKRPQPVGDKDISVLSLTQADFQQYIAQQKTQSQFTTHLLVEIPYYIWISTASPLNRVKNLNCAILSKYPYCVLKNTYDGIGTALILGYDVDGETPVVETKQNFLDNIERFGYYTIDFPLKNGFFYQELLAQRKSIALKKTTESFYFTVTYAKATCENFAALLMSTLSSYIMG